jgi:hypothetical protein
VHVAVQRVDCDLATGAACADDRHLAVEGNQLLVQQRGRAQLIPGGHSLLRGAHDGLPLAVIAHPACLEHTGHTDVAQRAPELGARADGLPTCRRDPQPLEQPFLADPVLRRRQRRNRRRYARLPWQRPQRVDGDVLPVERQNLASPCQLREPRPVGKRTVEQRRDLTGRSTRGRVQKQEVQAERIACQREHAAELAGTDDAYGHGASPAKAAREARGGRLGGGAAAAGTLIWAAFWDRGWLARRPSGVRGRIRAPPPHRAACWR